MQLFDTHFHFYADKETPEQYYQRIKTAELTWMLAAGGDFAESRTARDFASVIPNSYFAAGVHPHSAEKYSDGNIDCFSEFKSEDKLVAVGELGLDFFYDNSPRRAQCLVFENFLALALDWDLPAIVHCRDKDGSDDAYSRCYELLRDFAASGGAFEVHCFTGTEQWCEKFLALGAYIGISGIATFPGAQNVRSLLPLIPDDRLLLETDSPYLAPVPHRGKDKNPGYGIEVARKVAEEKKMTLETVAAATTANAFNFFRITETNE